MSGRRGIYPGEVVYATAGMEMMQYVRPWQPPESEPNCENCGAPPRASLDKCEYCGGRKR